MKFLVLALCVCAASAASFGSTPFGAGGYKTYKSAQNTVAAPFVAAAKAVSAAAAPVAAPVAVAAAATYQAGSTAYQGAKQVANKAYASNDGEAAILRSESNVGPDGAFQYAFETENGIKTESVGTYKQFGEAGGVVSQGSYRYTAPDGTPVIVTYTADENGYHPQSDLLPVGPEIPAAIARSLAYIAANSRDAVQKY